MDQHLHQFYNCKILRNSKIYNDALWIRNGKIVNPETVFYEEKILPVKRIDCNGALISPGFIDLQINGGFGYDFSTMTEQVADISVGVVARSILQFGVTSFCPTIITSPSEKYNQILPKVTKRPGNVKGAGILGIHVEGPFINPEKKGAHPEQYIKALTNGFDDVLSVYGSLDNICIITLAPELVLSGSVIEELVNRNIVVSLGHSECSLVEGEKSFFQGAKFITHLFNAMLPFHHRDPGLVGLLTSKKVSKTVFYGIIADGIHTHPAALRIAFHSNRKGLVLVTDAMAAMGLKDGLYCIGEQKVEVSKNKAVVAGTNTLSGSIATMDFCIRFLLKSTGCSLVEALECATLHPAQVLGISDSKGTLNFGSDADFVILNDDVTVQSTFIGGECVWEDG